MFIIFTFKICCCKIIYWDCIITWLDTLCIWVAIYILQFVNRDIFWNILGSICLNLLSVLSHTCKLQFSSLRLCLHWFCCWVCSLTLFLSIWFNGSVVWASFSCFKRLIVLSFSLICLSNFWSINEVYFFHCHRLTLFDLTTESFQITWLVLFQLIKCL